MAMVFCDSFDHYETADITRKWTGAAASTAINASAGRRSGGCMRFPTYNEYATKGVPAVATYTIGYAVYFRALSAAGEFLAFRDGATNQVIFCVSTAGAISAYRFSTANLLGTSASGVLSINGWLYLEVQVTISSSAGEVHVRVNGTEVLTITGANTQYSGSAVTDNIRLYGCSAASALDVDDLFINDTSGSYNTGFLNDIRVDCYYPSGDGNSSQMVGSDGNSTSNYALVGYAAADKGAMDDDSTFVESDTSGNKDTYAFDDITHDPVSIYAVQVSAASRKTATGSRAIAMVTRSGGADYDSSSFTLGDSYSVKSAIRERDPNGTIAWTKTNFNSAEFGIKIAS